MAVAAALSVIISWLGYRLNAASAQRERQRKAIEDWCRTLSKWVDDHGPSLRTPDDNYNLLTSREIIELSLPRRHRFLAWWMYEMAVAVMDRRPPLEEPGNLLRERAGVFLNPRNRHAHTRHAEVLHQTEVRFDRIPLFPCCSVGPHCHIVLFQAENILDGTIPEASPNIRRALRKRRTAPSEVTGGQKVDLIRCL